MDQNNLPFSKKNYLLMIIGIVIITIGFLIISLDGHPHGFGPMGLTIGPIITLAGFIFEFYAIFYKSEK
ncbi:DUF3098 domain-containing protein [Echinicola jeungdonensis]|uniref:DUF3098 domain-containing protein n=1 Tax=Echinicola jeungdonensis TaxID=709343 RepID=A0ABV5J5Z4_9BACT|nr:DUF3098 domain-containing protein [Echinicola jeungdonensis]MDN3670937.1 DUF3098 domain-containing protein [Echinicola jeungdonensis]